jgi:glutamyl-tRNA reductase
MITDMIGDLSGKRVLVVGAGSMGEGVAVALHRAGGADILVANRTADRGASLAERVDGSPSASIGWPKRSPPPT